MSTPFLAVLSIINVLFALMVLYFAARLNWRKREDRLAIVWFILLFGLLSSNTAAIGFFTRCLP